VDDDRATNDDAGTRRGHNEIRRARNSGRGGNDDPPRQSRCSGAGWNFRRARFVDLDPRSCMGKQSEERFDSWLGKRGPASRWTNARLESHPRSPLCAVQQKSPFRSATWQCGARRPWFPGSRREFFRGRRSWSRTKRRSAARWRRKREEKARFFSDRPRRRRAVHARAVHAFVAPRGGFARAVVERDETSASARRARRRRRWRARA